MQPIHDPFTPNATTTVRTLGPKRSTSLVVFDTNGCSIIDHPVAGTRHSALMVLSGFGDLVRTQPKRLAQQLLTLPEVVPAEQRRPDIEVPLQRPDKLDSDDFTTWTVIKGQLLIDQIGAYKAQLTFRQPVFVPDVHTLELMPLQWWNLVQALVSLDAWTRYLKRTVDVLARGVRRAADRSDGQGGRSLPAGPEQDLNQDLTQP
jgi:hypothetical protein